MTRGALTASVLASLAAGLLACAHTASQPAAESTLETWIARAGPDAFTRVSEIEVHYGFPGRWRWELAYRSPERFRLSLGTTGASHHYVFDGSALHAWLGNAPVSSDTRDLDAYRGIARWLGVASLRILADRRWTGFETTRAHGPLELWLAFEGGESYRLGIDDRGRVVEAHGPIEIPGIGGGRLSASFGDFRSVAGHEVPFRASYTLNGSPFFDERVVRFIPGVADLDPGAPEHQSEEL